MMMQTRFIVFTLILAAATLSGFAAQAAEPRLIETFGDWDAYVVLEDNNKVCYMASIPKKSVGNYSKRGEVFALITHRPKEGTKDVFSFITGYNFKPASDASVEIDGQKFSLFTKDDTAWAPDAETDAKIADALKAGKTMIVKGLSSRGTSTSDTFSLKGSTGAYDRITRECR